MTGIEFRMKPPLTEAELAPLLEEEWGEGAARGYGRALERSLTWVGAFQDGTLVGFVNVAWDGNLHAFIVDAIVRENLRGRGIGLELVRHAIAAENAPKSTRYIDEVRVLRSLGKEPSTMVLMTAAREAAALGKSLEDALR